MKPTQQVQADITDPEGVLGVMRSIQEEIQEIIEKAHIISEHNESRSESVRKCTELSDQLSEHLTDLLCHAETMETVIHEDEKSSLASNRDIDQLQSVHARLESMNGDEIEEVSDSDLDNEHRLIGFVADELSSKIEELSKFRQRLSDANDDHKYEWEQFRNEVRLYNVGATTLEATTDHLQELHLARFAGEETGTDDDSELLFRLVEHHMNQINHRKLQRELSEAIIKQKDLEEEIGTLMTQKQSLWKRYLDLEKCLERNDEANEDNTILRPTAAFSNLLDVIDGKFHPSMTHDLEQCEEESQHGGLYLHKCVTDINVKLNFSDDESDTDADGDTSDKILNKLPEVWNNPTGSTEDDSSSQKSSTSVVRNKMFNHMEEVPLEITQLRMRQNAGRRNSISHRNNRANTIIVSDSFKSFMPAGVNKKRRASHF